MTRNEQNTALTSWGMLNTTLMKMTDEDAIWSLLETELRTARRAQFALRIYSRYNKIRSSRERYEILCRTGFESVPFKVAASRPLRDMIERASGKR